LRIVAKIKIKDKEMITPEEIARVVAYLRGQFKNDRINIKPPAKPNAP